MTAQHSAHFAHVPQLQMWSRTRAAQPRGKERNPLHTPGAVRASPTAQRWK